MLAPAPDGTTCLYRQWAADGTLLYVGISLSVLTRLRRHRFETPWFHEVVTITIERHANRALALAAEQKAITSEHPRYNATHVKHARKFRGEPTAEAIRIRNAARARIALANGWPA